MQCEHMEAIHEIQHMQYKYKLQYIKTTYVQNHTDGMCK